MSNKFLALTAAAGMIVGLTTGAMAQSVTTPGHQMQENGSVKGTTGASGYAPGTQMREKGSVKGTTGASGYAPGHATTGASVNSQTDVKAGGMKANTGVNAGGNAKMK